MSPPNEQRIVVGVDGSPECTAALRWAVRQARLTGAAVEAVRAWQLPLTPGYACTPYSPDHYAAWAVRSLSDCVADARDAGPDVEVRQTVTRGDPVTALLDAADGADLLVLGNPGRRGAFARLPLRPTGKRCAHAAPCPVVLAR